MNFHNVPGSQSASPANEGSPDEVRSVCRNALAVDGKLLPVLVLIAGFSFRLVEAWKYFLNPDEALHHLLASQSSLELTYKAALTNAHPPLLILVLHYWRLLGQSELILRMPSVLAGTACCWLTYKWLSQVTDRSTAFYALLLFSLSPSLIGLSAEIRQYALLLCFMSACLYCSECAIRQNVQAWMILFSLSLDGALLTHYSSLIFAFTVGVFMLVRLYPYGERRRLFAIWACGQIVALSIAAYFLVTHVARLKQAGIPQDIAETWLRKSIFHPGENNVVFFVAVQTLRVFTYLLSHGVVGTVTLLAFLWGIFLLLRRKSRGQEQGPTTHELALLLSLPFMANCGAALAGAYPYGGTRHDAYLAMFGLSGAAIAIAAWKRARTWIAPGLVVAALAVCNLFPAPPPSIRARNHSRELMQEAAKFVQRNAAPGSLLFADYQSGLLLGYYVCGHGVVETFPPFEAFAKADCSPYTAITARPQEWKFYAEDLPGQLESVAKTYDLALGTKIWLFDAGWITDSAPTLRKEMQQFGCTDPRSFGENILLCELTLGGNRRTP